MKVILTENVDKLGQIGDVIEVKTGYARNYLFPRKYALEITPHNLTVMESRKKKFQKRLELEKLSAIDQKARLEGITISIRKKAGDNDVLFGSVTTAELEDQFHLQGVQIDRKKIHIDEPIKRIGNYSCKIKLFKDVEAEVKIEVTREEEIAGE